LKWLNRVFLLFLLLIFQFSILPRFGNIYLEPNLILIVVVLFALANRPEASCVLAFFLGLVMDVNTGDILGTNAFIWVQIAMLNTSIRKYLIIDSIPVQIMMTAISYLLASTIQFVLLRVAAFDEPVSRYFLLMFTRAAVTAVFTWPVSLIMFKYVISQKTDYA
jgi:rod shape-determining protein MreD